MPREGFYNSFSPCQERVIPRPLIDNLLLISVILFPAKIPHSTSRTYPSRLFVAFAQGYFLILTTSSICCSIDFITKHPRRFQLGLAPSYLPYRLWRVGYFPRCNLNRYFHRVLCFCHKYHKTCPYTPPKLNRPTTRKVVPFLDKKTNDFSSVLTLGEFFPDNSLRDFSFIIIFLFLVSQLNYTPCIFFVKDYFHFRISSLHPHHF